MANNLFSIFNYNFIPPGSFSSTRPHSLAKSSTRRRQTQHSFVAYTFISTLQFGHFTVNSSTKPPVTTTERKPFDMQIGPLVPLLALLAAPALARSSLHPNAAAHRRQDVGQERINSAVERREALAQSQPRALSEKPNKRKITRRGGRSCRARNSTATASDSATASATASALSEDSSAVYSDAESASSTQAPVENTSSSSENVAATTSSIENIAALQQPSSSSSVSFEFRLFNLGNKLTELHAD